VALKNAKCKIGSLESCSFNWISAYTLLCSVPPGLFVNNRSRTYIWIYFSRWTLWKMYKKLRWIIFCSSDATSIEKKKIKKEILLWDFSKIMFMTQMVQGPLQKKSKTKRREFFLHRAGQFINNTDHFFLFFPDHSLASMHAYFSAVMFDQFSKYSHKYYYTNKP